MIKILNTSQIKELDAFTIRKEPIASINLMERACGAFVDWFIQRSDSSKSILIVCGTGNNGGDGLGIARLLSLMPYRIKVYVVGDIASGSLDFTENLRRLPDRVERINLTGSGEVDFPSCDIVIDALFGSGLSRSLEGVNAQVVSALNQLNAIRIAVDIPSGLRADSHSDGSIFQAHYTVTFQLPKLSFLLPQYYSFVGEWHCVDIGLSSTFIKESQTKNYVVDEATVRKLIQPRKSLIIKVILDIP